MAENAEELLQEAADAIPFAPGTRGSRRKKRHRERLRVVRVSKSSETKAFGNSHICLTFSSFSPSSHSFFFTAGGLREEAARDRGAREEDAAPVVCRHQRAVGEAGLVDQVQESREGGNQRGGLKMHKE